MSVENYLTVTVYPRLVVHKHSVTAKTSRECVNKWHTHARVSGRASTVSDKG